MSLPRLWAYLAIGLPVLAALIANLSSVDLAYHLRAGADILDSAAIPHTDTYTFTAFGHEWVDQQWGAQVLVAAVFRAGGWTGLVVLRALLVGGTFGAVFAACRRGGLTLRMAAALTLTAFCVTAVALALRPQLIAITLFALLLLLVTERRRHPRLFWLAPVVIAAWVNVHGSFFLGPVVLGVAWLEDLTGGLTAGKPALVAGRNPTLIVALAGTAATLVNPFGPWVWAYAIGLSTNPAVTAHISEWEPTTLRTIPGIAFYASVLGVAAYLARRSGPTPWPSLALLGFLFLVGAYALRGVAWWPIGAAVAVGALIAPMSAWALEAEARAPRAKLSLVLAGAIVVAGTALLPVWRSSDPIMGPAGVVGTAPSGITHELVTRAQAGDRILAPQLWGSWFEFSVPQAQVFVDSRIELYQPDVLADYDAFRAGRAGWEQMLERRGVTIVVVAVDEVATMDRMAAAAGWRAVFEDQDGRVFVPR